MILGLFGLLFLLTVLGADLRPDHIKLEKGGSLHVGDSIIRRSPENIYNYKEIKLHNGNITKGKALREFKNLENKSNDTSANNKEEKILNLPTDKKRLPENPNGEYGSDEDLTANFEKQELLRDIFNYERGLEQEDENKKMQEIENPKTRHRNLLVDDSIDKKKKELLPNFVKYSDAKEATMDNLHRDSKSEKNEERWKENQARELESEKKNHDRDFHKTIDSIETRNNQGTKNFVAEEASEEGSFNPNAGHYDPRSRNILQKTRTVDFLEHVVKFGKEKIQSVSQLVQSTLRVNETTLSKLLNTAFEKYTTKMKDYISYTISQDTKSNIDREFLLLDVIASCNLLLYSEERKLLSKMIENRSANVTQHEIDLLTEEVYQQYLDHKKQELFHLCQKLNICRSFPGISDYFAELITEILKLPNERLRVVIKTINRLISQRTNFFKAFMRDSIANMIGRKLEEKSANLEEFKEILAILRGIITQRFKLMQTNDYELKTRTKAVRILIDIIDKTFAVTGGEELNDMTFDTAKEGLRRWANGDEKDVHMPLKLVMEHLVAVIRNHWDEIIRDEVTTLFDVIMVGKTEAVEMYQFLFSTGSTIGSNQNVLTEIGTFF